MSIYKNKIITNIFAMDYSVYKSAYHQTRMRQTRIRDSCKIHAIRVVSIGACYCLLVYYYIFLCFRSHVEGEYTLLLYYKAPNSAMEVNVLLICFQKYCVIVKITITKLNYLVFLFRYDLELQFSSFNTRFGRYAWAENRRGGLAFLSVFFEVSEDI